MYIKTKFGDLVNTNDGEWIRAENSMGKIDVVIKKGEFNFCIATVEKREDALWLIERIFEGIKGGTPAFDAFLVLSLLDKHERPTT